MANKMKIIITSDTHKEREQIEMVKQYAIDNGIKTIVDCGDLHGEIDAFAGINLHSVFWDEASGGMDRWEFSSEMRSIDATMHENGSTFVLDNTAIYIRHNLADYESQIPQIRFNQAKTALDDLVTREEQDLKKLVLFGHTHKFHLHKDENVLALNPGSLGLSEPNAFIVFDTETREVEYRTKDTTILKINDYENTDVVQIRDLIVNDNGSINSYIARSNDDQERLVFQETNSPKYKRINHVHAIIDDYDTPRTLEEKALGVTKNNGKEVVVFEGKETAEYDSIIKITDVHDAITKKRTVMFLAEKNGQQVWATLNGKETNAYGLFDETPKLFDGEVFYIAKREKEDDNVNHTRNRKEQPSILVRGWSDESTELMEYKIINLNKLTVTNSDIAIVAGNSWDSSCVNHNGQETETYDSIRDVTFLDNKLAFVARNGDEEFVVYDGCEQDHYQTPSKWDRAISNITLVDGKLTYSIIENNEERVICDGEMVAGPFPKTDYYAPIKKLDELDGELICLTKNNGVVQIHYKGQTISFDKDSYKSHREQLEVMFAN